MADRLPVERIEAIAFAAIAEVERLRPVVEVAKAVVDAKSGEERARAIDALFGAVARLRANGR